MNKYNWRNSLTLTASDSTATIRGKLACKTKETVWLNTEDRVIVLVSIYSEFHKGLSGTLKLMALISSIRAHVKGKITILLADQAHFHTLSLHRKNALVECEELAKDLMDRHLPTFEDCQVVYWRSYIGQDSQYASSMRCVKELYQKDALFKAHVMADAEACYTPERQFQFPNRAQFLEKAIEDIFEQCACILVLAEKGYRYQFYPGKSNASCEYVNSVVLPHNKQIFWIHVFLAIEKTTKLPHPRGQDLISCFGDQHSMLPLS